MKMQPAELTAAQARLAEARALAARGCNALLLLAAEQALLAALKHQGEAEAKVPLAVTGK